jgi:hypothetical protein
LRVEVEVNRAPGEDVFYANRNPKERTPYGAFNGSDINDALGIGAYWLGSFTPRDVAIVHIMDIPKDAFHGLGRQRPF